jgi:hypothetical protein
MEWTHYAHTIFKNFLRMQFYEYHTKIIGTKMLWKLTDS